MSLPDRVQALILVATAGVVGVLWMCHAARTDALRKRLGLR